MFTCIPSQLAFHYRYLSRITSLQYMTFFIRVYYKLQYPLCIHQNYKNKEKGTDCSSIPESLNASVFIK